MKVKSFVVLTGLLITAVVATYARYQSFDPCDWMMRDLTESSSLPDIVVAAVLEDPSCWKADEREAEIR